MHNKFKLFTILLVAGIFGAFYFSGVVFAEGPGCTGAITGNIAQSNVNVGDKIYFDGENGGVDLSIVLGEGATGTAPDKAYAACAANTGTTGGPIDNDEGEIRGYVWSDNVGFISFSCANGDNEGISCGDFPYGVKIGPDSGGTRQLSGYAWNGAFGYINFFCDGLGGPCGGIPYGVTLGSSGTPNADGSVTYTAISVPNKNSYAYSQAGIFLKFDGMKLTFPKEEETPPIESECGKANWSGKIVCMEMGLAEGPEYANGEDGYEMFVYLKDENGVPVTKPQLATFTTKYHIDLTPQWADTVRLNQSANETKNFNMEGAPGSLGGGITAKPVSKITLMPTTLTTVISSAGKYKLAIPKIASYAPTFQGNTSMTVSTTPPYEFFNEMFFVGDKTKVPTPRNYLKLNSILCDIKDNGVNFPCGDSNSKIYANGIPNFPLVFKPVFEIRDLYQPGSGGDEKLDMIEAYRDVPITIKAGGYKNGDFSLSEEAVDVKFKLYSEPVTPPANNLTCKQLEFKFDGGGLEGNYNMNDFSGETDLKITSSISGTGEACSSKVKSPALYSIISYRYDGKDISYFSNKLPRLDAGTVGNASVVVHGNIYGQFANVTSSEVDPILTSGDAVLNVVKDTVRRNIKKYVKETANPSGIYNLSNFNSPSFSVGDEKVIYLNKKIVNLPAQTWTGKVVVIVDGGNLFINGDLYNSDSDGKQLVLVVLRDSEDVANEDFGKSGNIYVKTDVKNIQANVVADGSIFSYVGEIDDKYGEPNDLAGYYSGLTGANTQLLWEGSIAARNTIGGADFLGQRDKLFYRGGIAGNASIKEKAQLYDLNYLRLFKLNVETENGLIVDQQCGKALTAQDQADIYDNKAVCGIRSTVPCFTTANPPVQKTYNKNQKTWCDGIDALHIYSVGKNRYDNPPSGDLVPDPSLNFSKGLANNYDSDTGKCTNDNGDIEACQFDPVYIFYKPANSFMFKSN